MKIQVRQIEFLINKLKEKEPATGTPMFCLFLGAGCSYTSGIPLGGQVIEILKRECFITSYCERPNTLHLDNFFNANSNDDKFSLYKTAVDDYLVSIGKKVEYEKYIEEKEAYFKEQIDLDKGNYAADYKLPSKLNKEDLSWEAIKECIYPDTMYGFWFEEYSPDARTRQKLIELLIEAAQPKAGYLMLSHIIKEGYIKNIFTTNFDDLLYDSLMIYTAIKPRVYAQQEISHYVNYRATRPNIIKLHGDFLFQNIRNTLAEINQDENLLNRKVNDALNDFSLVVIGYNGADYSIMKLLESAKYRNRSTPFQLIWCDRKDPEELNWRTKRLLESYPNSFYVKLGFDELMAKLLISYELANKPGDLLKDLNQERVNELRKIQDEYLKNNQLSKSEKKILDYYWDNFDENLPTDAQLEHWKKAKEEYPDQSGFYHNYAFYLSKQLREEKIFEKDPRIEEVKTNYETAITIYDSTLSRNSYASFLMDIRDLQAARIHFLRAIQIEPGKATGYFYYGDLLLKLGLFSEAEENFIKAISIDNKRSDFYTRYAYVLCNQNKYELAKENYLKAIEVNAKSVNPFCAYAFFLAKINSDFKGAEENIKLALAIDAESPYILQCQAAIELVKFHLNKNSKHLKNAIRLCKESEKKEYAAGAYNLSCAYILQKDETQAMEWLDIALKNNKITYDSLMNDSDWKEFKTTNYFQDLIKKYFPYR